MIDYATQERRQWIARMQMGQRPANWILDKRYSPKADESVDREIRAKMEERRTA